MVVALSGQLDHDKPLIVEANHTGKVDGKYVKVQYANTISATVCDSSCKYMFPLDSQLVFILNAGDSIRIAVSPQAKAVRRRERSNKPNNGETYSISGQGFAETLTESSRAW